MTRLLRGPGRARGRRIGEPDPRVAKETGRDMDADADSRPAGDTAAQESALPPPATSTAAPLHVEPRAPTSSPIGRSPKPPGRAPAGGLDMLLGDAEPTSRARHELALPSINADGRTLLAAVYREATPENGEDAQPLVTCGHNGAIALGVFDGMGGAGGARYVFRGVERKGAYLASRMARQVAARVAAELLSQPAPDITTTKATSDEFARNLDEQLRVEFSLAAAELDGEQSKLRSSLVRLLPTTAAIALIWPSPQHAGDAPNPPHLVTAAWAGDSRIYLLDPTYGLAQLSRDDTRVETDALASLISDPPIDNCISASQQIRVNTHASQFREPTFVIAASDGCFGYFPTPAHFEFELLDTLQNAASLNDWQRLLLQRFDDVARDDASLAIAMVDFHTFLRAQDAFRTRWSYVEREFVTPYRERQRETAAAERKLSDAKAHRDTLVEAQASRAKELWEKYRTGYEQWLPARPRGGAE
jgi:serine/threonine protein phosphatase PrpC